MKKLVEKHVASLRQLQVTMQKKTVGVLRAMAAAQRTKREAAETALRAKRTAALQHLAQHHAAQLQQQQKRWQAETAEALKVAAAQCRTTLSQLKERQKQTLDEHRGRLVSAVTKARSDALQKMAEEHKQSLDDLKAELTAQSAKTLAQAALANQTAMQRQRVQLASELGQKEEEEKAEIEEQIITGMLADYPEELRAMFMGDTTDDILNSLEPPAAEGEDEGGSLEAAKEGAAAGAGDESAPGARPAPPPLSPPSAGSKPPSARPRPPPSPSALDL